MKRQELTHIWVEWETGECINSKTVKMKGEGRFSPVWLGTANTKLSHIIISVQNRFIHLQILVLFTPPPGPISQVVGSYQTLTFKD